MSKFKIEVSKKFQIGIARREVCQFAKKIGFTEKNIAEIAIVVTELAENLVTHKAINGKIIYSSFKNEKGHGIQLISKDDGPGISNIEAVMEDGYSTKGSLGFGLGAIKRLMSDFELSSNNGIEKKLIGTKIVTRKYVPQKRETYQDDAIRTHFGIFTRSRFDEEYNGDGYFLKYFDGKTLAVVIDGLGHGINASEATVKAQQSLAENYDKPLSIIIGDLHERLKKTRGVAISLALINDAKCVLEYLGIGNVLTKQFNQKVSKTYVNYNGTVGHVLGSFRVLEYPWTKGSVLIMTSDGISSNYEPQNISVFWDKNPIIIANSILKNYGRTIDDATVLVGVYR